MESSQEEKWKTSSISRRYPSFRDVSLKTVQSWIDGKNVDDNAEGLWRVHDGIYDLTDFINHHPGGSFWLKETKGTDITEAFEAHHISTAPAKLLEKFKVRDAKEPRNITLTFKEDGFYRTLKKRVRQKLETVDFSPSKRSDIIHTALLMVTILLCVESVVTKNNVVAFLASLVLCWTVISSHNYFHRRDNWRMYTFNLSLMNYKDWRISHALSHHLYPNTFHDLELSMYEPYLCWVPNPYIKNWFQRYGSWIYGPIVYTATFASQLVLRLIYSIQKKNIMYWDDLLIFSLPAVMYVFSGSTLLESLKTWLLIEFITSFIFGVIGINAAHHHPDILHDGDAMRSDRDWGLFQLDSIKDRAELKGSQFLVLTHFGDHALHHLFPTLDHGILPQLYPVLFETLDEFKGQFEAFSWFEHFIGQHKQLARITPNKIPPGQK